MVRTPATTLGKLIYKSLLQITKQYDLQRLPLTGVVGFTESRFKYPLSLVYREALQAKGREPNFDAGFRAVKQLQAQYSILAGAGPTELASYAIWHQTLSEGTIGVSSPYSAIDSSIWGSFVAAKMLRHPHPEEELDDSPLQDLHETCQAAHASRKPTDKQAVSGWPTMEKSLQNLADEVQDAADADLFNKAIECQAPTADIPLAQMRLITKTLFHKGRFRQEPFEWVYEGLLPLNILDVLRTGKGISLTLAVIFAGVARQLEVPVSLMPILEAPVPEVAIPENIRRRQATQTIATAPEPNGWLVRTEWPAYWAAQNGQTVQPAHRTLSVHTSVNEMQPCFVDPVKGLVMTLAECQQKYPHMQLDAPWVKDTSTLQVLAEFARVAVTAHQRRGESDAVAFWMYQLMALDAMAPEWQHVMT